MADCQFKCETDKWFLVQVRLRTEVLRTPSHDRGSISWPPDHDSTFHVTKTPALIAQPWVTIHTVNAKYRRHTIEKVIFLPVGFCCCCRSLYTSFTFDFVFAYRWLCGWHRLQQPGKMYRYRRNKLSSSSVLLWIWVLRKILPKRLSYFYLYLKGNSFYTGDVDDKCIICEA